MPHARSQRVCTSSRRSKSTSGAAARVAGTSGSGIQCSANAAVATASYRIAPRTLTRQPATGVERDVTFEATGPELANDVTAAYHAKYDRYGPRIVGSVVSADAVRSTLRVMPA